jgi:hypothetical protein
MADPGYVRSMRQDLIKNVYYNLSSSSEFHFTRNDGEDCLVQTIDNLINA